MGQGIRGDRRHNLGNYEIEALRALVVKIIHRGGHSVAAGICGCRAAGTIRCAIATAIAVGKGRDASSGSGVALGCAVVGQASRRRERDVRWGDQSLGNRECLCGRANKVGGRDGRSHRV